MESYGKVLINTKWMKTCVRTIVIRWQCVQSWTALLDQLTPTYMYLPLHTSSPEYIFNKIAWVRSYGGMIIVFIWRHHFMTSLFLLFYSLFSEVNISTGKVRGHCKKSVLSQRELCKSMPSTLPNFNGVWLKLCHEQFF